MHFGFSNSKSLSHAESFFSGSLRFVLEPAGWHMVSHMFARSQRRSREMTLESARVSCLVSIRLGSKSRGPANLALRSGSESRYTWSNNVYRAVILCEMSWTQRTRFVSLDWYRSASFLASWNVSYDFSKSPAHAQSSAGVLQEFRTKLRDASDVGWSCDGLCLHEWIAIRIDGWLPRRCFGLTMNTSPCYGET
jgi:hypothetical protein